jgi:pimeloyl-ACP methyl ester carboxylesterase
MQSYRSARVGLPLGRITAPVLIVYGYQDFEPITQAYLLREQLPHAQLCLLNECGHLPWLEQPELFYTALTEFLSA